ncbi:cysteine desulfurase family protein [Mangrovivirga sp. M17]|uniref:Cysteine desulfurase family protein n=1 Tax=Mangrovivirga halotolerans TaxID=2993936 RepID=A0ABT3RSL4_9BACT|nr:cysteine desulfurase family protein [Mangrovivirga halotolerans]MCX2744764.1 cysteine desulfurase family protein [Mangrovivirga halotolerans]
MRFYFDNAATTPIDERVLEVMIPLMRDGYGNPSSTHAHGRAVRSEIESARKKVAQLINATPSEIFFTSGGTEADNMALRCAVETFGYQRLITSRIEHHAVLHTAEYLNKHGIELCFVELDSNGVVNYDHLESLLKEDKSTIVSLMHANNEIGNLTDIQKVSDLCKEYEAFFHTDTVQTMGHFEHDVKKLDLNTLAASAHKFHGPKGAGFIYVNKNKRIPAFIHGGAQERGLRGGTENVYGIVGLAKALELSYDEMSEDRANIEKVKTRIITRLKDEVEGVTFNGMSNNLKNSLYTVLSVNFPERMDKDMLLFNLDLKGISCSGGSACSSGAATGSHVLAELDRNENEAAVRFSFGRFNTEEEADYLVNTIKEFDRVNA